MQRPALRLVAASLLIPFAPAHAQPAASIATNSPTPLSTRVVSYTIDANVDMDKKALDATEALSYKNLTGQPLSTFPFHLYLNAFQPQSSFTTETHFTGGIRDNEAENSYPAKKMGSIVISQLVADGYGDLTQAMHFISPDDNNPKDKTVMQIALPHPLLPNQTITFRMKFHDQFPESIARNGYKRDFLMGGQWFPKVGVFWHGAWNCHQYHSTTEFFSDFGVYDVRLTVPKRYVVGATGVPTGTLENANGTKTLSFYAEDVGDFGWAASPHFQVTDGVFLSSMGPVQIHVLALAAHPGAGPRYLKIMQETLEQFDRRYGPYPYKMLTVIDPEPGSQIGGMEYPTLFTGDTNWYEPTHLTEETAEHEFGHQYWYGMVATNEFEDAWLDEGINSYTEVKVLDAILGRNTSMIAFPWANAGDWEMQRLEYILKPDFDPVTRHAWQFRDSTSYGGVTYGKTATLLQTLEGIIGPDTMADAMRTYFLRFRFQHPTTEDFLRTIEQVAVAHGKAIVMAPSPNAMAAPVPFTQDDASIPPVHSSLRPFFNQAVYGTQVLDYAVDSMSSDPVRWWLPAAKNADIRSTVYLHRKGGFVLPVTLEVVFSDGSRLREHWDGVDRWKRFDFVRKARVVSAEIDPDHTVLLDKDFFNNSRTEQADTTPMLKLANLWLSVQQLASQFAAWLV